jgi:hypothetical protein
VLPADPAGLPAQQCSEQSSKPKYSTYILRSVFTRDAFSGAISKCISTHDTCLRSCAPVSGAHCPVIFATHLKRPDGAE